MKLRLDVREERWQLRKPFKISRETRRHASTVYCELFDGEHVGRGEAAGVSYKGETTSSILLEIEAMRARIERGIDRDALQTLLKPGGARNLIDCALWDLECKRSGQTIWQLLGRRPKPVQTVYTVGIDEPKKMALDAAAHIGFKTLKVKVGEGDPILQVAAVHRGSREAQIVVDANQAWTLKELETYAPKLADLGVAMIEQPLPAGEDVALEDYASPIALCADESCHTRKDLPRLRSRYQFVNIKLDKTGGLTEALALADAAREAGFQLMVGNMLGSSLAMAPGFVIAQDCIFVDLDGPLLQKEDREHAMTFDNGRITTPDPELWG